MYKWTITLSCACVLIGSASGGSAAVSVFPNSSHLEYYSLSEIDLPFGIAAETTGQPPVIYNLSQNGFYALCRLADYSCSCINLVLKLPSATSVRLWVTEERFDLRKSHVTFSCDISSLVLYPGAAQQSCPSVLTTHDVNFRFTQWASHRGEYFDSWSSS